MSLGFETRHGLMLMKGLEFMAYEYGTMCVTVLCESCHCTTSRNQDIVIIIILHLRHAAKIDTYVNDA